LRFSRKPRPLAEPPFVSADFYAAERLRQPLGYLGRAYGEESLMSIRLTGVLAALRVRISDAALLDDLRTFLEAAECPVRNVGLGTLDVTMPRAPSSEQAEREVAIYLRTWQAMHPGADARIVGEGCDPRFQE
jgi:hypothetical protein